LQVDSTEEARPDGRASFSETDPSPCVPQLFRLEFRGSGAEYFRIWIVNLLLTLVTLGLYGAWAKVRRMRYFYGHTLLAGSAFEYHGEPKRILKGRLIAAALIAPYYLFQKSLPLVSLVFALLFVIALPFIVVQSRRFQLRVSSWRNVRFGFDGGYAEAARLYLGIGMLVPLSLGLIIPYFEYLKQSFFIRNSRYGNTPFRFEARLGRFYVIYLIALALMMAVGVVAAVAFASSGFGAWIAKLLPQLARSRWLILLVLLFYAFAFAVISIPLAYVNSRVTNECLNHTLLGSNRLQSRLSARHLAGLYIGNLVLVVLTLGLYSPWAKIRLLRYRLESTAVLAEGQLAEFTQAASPVPGATGEELGDLLDVDFGF